MYRLIGTVQLVSIDKCILTKYECHPLSPFFLSNFFVGWLGFYYDKLTCVYVEETSSASSTFYKYCILSSLKSLWGTLLKSHQFVFHHFIFANCNYGMASYFIKLYVLLIGIAFADF